MQSGLSSSELQNELSTLDGWRVDGKRLFREFRFADFASAFGFMSSVALAAESMNHHPEWSNVYTQVKIWLSSHEIDNISQMDIDLARRINALWSVSR